MKTSKINNINFIERAIAFAAITVDMNPVNSQENSISGNDLAWIQRGLMSSIRQ